MKIGIRKTNKYTILYFFANFVKVGKKNSEGKIELMCDKTAKVMYKYFLFGLEIATSKKLIDRADLNAMNSKTEERNIKYITKINK